MRDDVYMDILTIASQKGGAGPVAVVDTDP
jgi:hypothetical protein